MSSQWKNGEQHYLSVIKAKPTIWRAIEHHCLHQIIGSQTDNISPIFCIQNSDHIICVLCSVLRSSKWLWNCAWHTQESNSLGSIIWYSQAQCASQWNGMKSCSSRRQDGKNNRKCNGCSYKSPGDCLAHAETPYAATCEIRCHFR